MLAPAKSRKIKSTVALTKPGFLEAVDAVRRVAAANLIEENAHTNGQVFTPAHVARLMASMSISAAKNIHLLDAGAGTGMLTAACIERFCQNLNKPEKIFATAVEVDESLLPVLRHTLDLCRAECEKCGIVFSCEIVSGDFLAFAYNQEERRYNLAILNPPYSKINTRSEASQNLRERGIIAPNYYAAFLALCAELLDESGELVAITPRSFANGTYFKPFRKYFLERMNFIRFHIFESRKEVFDSDVLQENVVFHAIKSNAKSENVIISTSRDGKAAIDDTRTLTYDQLIYPNDAELFIHLDGDMEKSETSPISHFRTSLEELGLKASTGRVVDFRAKEFLQNGFDSNESNYAVPLLYPHNMKSGRVVYPIEHTKKFNAIRCTPETQSQLVENGTYVLVKRFSAKEEKRRITAALHTPKDALGDKIGFENHLNYFHANGSEIEPLIARGLTIYLNSALIDNYFRRFSGHTQVNATDLRYLKYPTMDELKALGKHYKNKLPSPAEIDELIAQLIPDE